MEGWGKLGRVSRVTGSWHGKCLVELAVQTQQSIPMKTDSAVILAVVTLVLTNEMFLALSLFE